MNLPCCRCQWVSCTPRRCWSKGCCSTSHSRGSLLAEYTSPQTGTPCSSDNHSVLTLWVQQQLEYIQYIDICDECAHNGVFTLSSKCLCFNFQFLLQTLHNQKIHKTSKAYFQWVVCKRKLNDNFFFFLIPCLAFRGNTARPQYSITN